MSILASPKRVSITGMATKFGRFTNTFIVTATEKSLVKSANSKPAVHRLD